jgi:cob(I)alamin adenosyltransferase
MPVDLKKSNLYTKTGDKGTSSLYNGERRQKDDYAFQALGDTDELNAAIGLAREYCELSENGLHDMLATIQSRLFDVGAAIATPTDSTSARKKKYTEFSPNYTTELERWIDELDSQLPPITNFVIPSGGLTSCHLNHARTVCRRAERSLIPLLREEQVSDEVGKYMNRLSDLLFAAKRIAVAKEGKEELLWKKAKFDDPTS